MPGKRVRSTRNVESRSRVSRSRSNSPNTSRPRRTLLMDIPENWTAKKLCSELSSLGIDLPTSTLNRTLVRIYKQYSSKGVSTQETRGDLQNDNNSEVRIEPWPSTSGVNNEDVVRIEPCAGISTSGVNINDGGCQEAAGNLEEMSSLRLEIATMQAKIASLTRGTVDNFNNSSYQVHVNPDYCRKPIDSLESVNLVPRLVRNKIKENKYVNLALLLIPGMETGGETKVIDSAGNHVVVKASDPRLQRDLTIDEFRLAFSKYKDVVCEEDESIPMVKSRRRELDIYSNFIDSLHMQYGGSLFYDYHKQFAKKVEQHEAEGNKVDWRFKDTDLYLRIFAGASSIACDHCQSKLHITGFCPNILSHVNSPSNNKVDSYANSTHQQRIPVIMRTNTNIKTDRLGRPRQMHEGREICNKYNTSGCRLTHDNFAHIVHICYTCKGDHPATGCNSIQ